MKNLIKKIDSILFNKNIQKIYRKIYGLEKNKLFFKNKFPHLKHFFLSYYWNNFFKYIIKKKIRGDIVECGVGNGVSLSIILFNLIYFDKYYSDKKKYFGFDSFQGFPQPSVFDQSIRNPERGQWDHADIPFLFDCLINSGFKNEHIKKFVNFKKGYFSQTFKNFDISSICLLHIDCDLYESTKLSLEKFYPKVISNGLIVFDEYLDVKTRWPGAVKAIDDFFGKKKNQIQFDKIAGKYFYIKP